MPFMGKRLAVLTMEMRDQRIRVLVRSLLSPVRDWLTPRGETGVNGHHFMARYWYRDHHLGGVSVVPAGCEWHLSKLVHQDQVDHHPH